MFICEIYVPRGVTANHPGPGYWLPADGAEWGDREQAIATAAEWEAEGCTARITQRRTA